MQCWRVSYKFLGEKDDLTTNNFGAGKSITFEVTTKVEHNANYESLRDATVTVTIVDDENFKLETERTIRVVPQ